MASFSHADIAVGEVLYDNAIRGATSSAYSGTLTDGFGIGNAYDWRDFSLFAAESASSTDLDFVVSENKTIDTFSAFVSAYTGTGSHSIVLKYESAPAVFTTLSTIATTDRYVTWDDFSEVTVLSGRKIRFSFVVGTENLLIRQLVVGKKLTLGMGQWNGINPPRLNSGVVVTNNISVNGSFIGRSIKRLEKKGNIALTNLTESWVRTYWDPFSIEATKHTFIYRWFPSDYPDEVSFAAGSIEAPTNSGPAGAMSVSMPLQIITE